MKGVRRRPDFCMLAQVLEKQRPARATLFEMMLNDEVERRLAGSLYCVDTPEHRLCTRIAAFAAAGYDYATMHASSFHFRTAEHTGTGGQTVSLNDSLIADRAGFDRYVWNEPEDFTLEPFEKAAHTLPDGMKIIVYCPCGVLENAVAIAGYENLCLMAYDDEQLMWDLFEQIGSRLVRYLRRVLDYDFVGAVMCNDDWGFNTQTKLAPADMRRFVFPWHKQMVADAHEKGKYALLHSCGNYTAILDDVIDDMRFDGRHSYEDAIIPVEQAYEDYRGRIAVLGGIDMDFLARSPVQAIQQRCQAMLERADRRGGYALGSGNSIAPYVPFENYMAMLQVVYDTDR